MKLAEAVIERKAVGSKIRDLQSTIQSNLKIEEGTEPAEDVGMILEELVGTYARFEALVRGINEANNRPQEEADGLSISEMIVQRDTYRSMAHTWRQFAEEAGRKESRYGVISKDSVRMLPAIPPSELRLKADLYTARAKQVDLTIQRLDWVVDVTIPG